LPVKVAVIVPALKFPEAFLAIIVFATFDEVALLLTVKIEDPELL